MKQLITLFIAAIFVAGITGEIRGNQQQTKPENPQLNPPPPASPVSPHLVPPTPQVPPVPIQSMPSTNPNDLNKAKSANPVTMPPQPDSTSVYPKDLPEIKDTLK